MRPLHISFGGKHRAEVQNELSLSWEDFCARLLQPTKTVDKTTVGWFCPAKFSPAYRDSDNLIERHALTFDYDHVTAADLAHVQKEFAGFEYLIYTTWSHTPEKPRVRIVMPTTRPMSPEEFCAVSRKVASFAGIELAARESHVPAQFMYMPGVKPDGVFKGARHAGQWVNPDSVLDGWDWKDHTQWPSRKDGDTTHNPTERPDPPDTKPGVVGAFCRAFTVEEAIEKFDLPYEKVR